MAVVKTNKSDQWLPLGVMLLGLVGLGLAPRVFFPSEYPLQMFDVAALAIVLRLSLGETVMPSRAFYPAAAMVAAILTLGSATLAWLGLALVGSLLLIWHPERRFAAFALVLLALYQGPGLFVVNQFADVILSIEAALVADMVSPFFSGFEAVQNIIVTPHGQMIVLLGCSALPSIAGLAMLHLAAFAWAGREAFWSLCFSLVFGVIFLFVLNSVRLASMAYDAGFNALMHTDWAAFIYGMVVYFAAIGLGVVLSHGEEAEKDYEEAYS